MATIQQLKAMARPRGGKGAARAERRQGRVPGVIYGDNKDPITISVDHAELKRRIYAGRFLSTIYEIELDGAKHRVIPRDFQLDPVKDLPVHVDFMRLGLGAKIRVRIPIKVLNADQSPGVKRGGTVNIVTHTVEVQCAPEEIPEAIEVDISSLEINYSKHLSDIALPKSLRVVERIDPTLVTIVPPSGYAEEMKAAAEAAAAAAAAAALAPVAGAPAEGGVAAAPGAAAPAPGAAAPAAAAPAAPKK
jgi:large subunit ribosomal protein L25